MSIQALSETAEARRSEPEAPASRRALIAVPDRATREAAAALARLTYCAQLKEVRERRGVTLTSIADRSKVSEGLYAALERADVSRWPTGIYRRSFFREYAIALGLPVDSALSEFQQLFPEEGEQRTPAALVIPSGPMRMTLAGRTWLRAPRIQIVASLVDFVIVAVVTSLAAWLMPFHPGAIAATVAIMYYSLATACLASSPASWWLRGRGSRKRARALRLAR